MERKQQKVAPRIVLVGLNHRTAPVELRERASFNAEQALRAGQEVRARGVLEQAVVLSTCNRSELYGVVGAGAEDLRHELERFFLSFHEIGGSGTAASLYHHHDLDAARHLFRVAAGLDSMLLGEAEILGQVRQAYMLALEHGATGPLLNKLFQSALEVGKRVRTETDLGTRPMSAAYAAVKLAEQIFGRLKGHSSLIVGAGAMGEQVAEHMRHRGISRILVTNRSRERSEELAQRISGEIVEWEDLTRSLPSPDIVVTSVSSASPPLTRQKLAGAMESRGGRSLFVIDLGVPRNVEPAAADIYNLYLYNIDDLQQIVNENKQAREQEVPRAEQLVAGQLEKFWLWRADVEAQEILGRLRGMGPGERQEFLQNYLADTRSLSSPERERIVRLSADLLERVARHAGGPLQDDAEMRRTLREIEAARNIFALDRGEA